jgi:hypothetical protein
MASTPGVGTAEGDAMTRIELRTKVGPDGVLTLTVPVGLSEANREVKVVVESVEPALKRAPEMTREEWQRFVAETAGSVTDPGFQRPEQGEYERRVHWP